MAQDIGLAGDLWLRYQYIRDNGHLDYIRKAKQCEDFFVGLQWDPSDLALLKLQRRPALTINKIISTMSNVMGEQIYNRSEIAFRPARGEASQAVADALTKTFRHISDDNLLDWIRSDVFADGIIGSRGYYDQRLDFSDNLGGEIRITKLNPKNVLVDPDAEEYDPDYWNDVFTTKWMSPDMISLLYNEEDGKALEGRDESFWPYGYDSIDRERDRFGTPRAVTYNIGAASAGLVRNVRVIERQYKKLDKMQFFVDMKQGDMREVPGTWDRNRIAHELESAQGRFTIIKKLANRIRWTVVADKYVLHDDWSPYKHFTIVPYFPHFRGGRTTGLVENLIGPQELLNKTSSQELHIVNTTANSGWKIQKNSLVNMSIAELEQRGAQTGLVLELEGIDNAEKITPNATPTGLDRISYKAEEHIKSISGVPDSAQGFSREDVAAKAIKASQQASSANTAKVIDNLRRTDHILARNGIDMIQDFYTEERLMFIVSDRLTGATEPLVVNQITPEGEIINDLTVGEYAVTVTSEPQRDSYEDSQFDQAIMLRTEAGVKIPDSVLIKNSKLRDKADIVKEIDAESNSPEAKQQKQLEQRGMIADVATKEAEAASKGADAHLKTAQANKAMAEAGDASVPNAEMMKVEKEHALEVEKMEREFGLKKELADREYELKVRQMEQDMQLKERAAQSDEKLKRAQAAATMKMAAQQPMQGGQAMSGAAPGGDSGGKHKIEVSVGPASTKAKKFRMKKGKEGSMDVEEYE